MTLLYYVECDGCSRELDSDHPDMTIIGNVIHVCSDCEEAMWGTLAKRGKKLPATATPNNQRLKALCEHLPDDPDVEECSVCSYRPEPY